MVVATVEESNLETFLFGTAAWEVALFGGSGKYVESDCEPLKLFHNCFNEAVYSLFEIRKGHGEHSQSLDNKKATNTKEVGEGLF